MFVLDFQNNADAITYAFQDYYRTTLLSDETDPNKLHDLKTALEETQVFSQDDVLQVVELFLSGAERDKLDPILDRCEKEYKERLDEDQKIEFKGKAKSFARSYDFLASVLPYSNAEWERLSIFLNLLIPKLPAPQDSGPIQGILEAIDMDSYRVEKKQAMKIALADQDAEIDPTPPGSGGMPGSQIDVLSNILKTFNEQYAKMFQDPTRVSARIVEDIAPKVAADTAYKNAKANTPHTARMAHDQALHKVMQGTLKDDTQLYKLFVENEGFRRALSDIVFNMTSARV